MFSLMHTTVIVLKRRTTRELAQTTRECLSRSQCRYFRFQFRMSVKKFSRNAPNKAKLSDLHIYCVMLCIPGQNMDKSISAIVALFDRYKDIEY